MALKPCKECGREISTEAKSCPHCGKLAPTGPKTSPLAAGCLVLIILAVIGSALSSLGDSGSGSRNSSLTSLVDTSTPAVTPAGAPASEAPVLGSQWSYDHDQDEMTGKTTHTASVLSTNTVQFDFPYQGAQHGRLMLRRHPRYGRDVIFSIEKGQLLCPSYEGCEVLVRFDEHDPVSFSAGAPSDNSTEVLFIRDYDTFVTRLKKSTTVRISPQVYQQGTVIFTFDVSGFDPAKYTTP